MHGSESSRMSRQMCRGSFLFFVALPTVVSGSLHISQASSRCGRSVSSRSLVQPPGGSREKLNMLVVRARPCGGGVGRCVTVRDEFPGGEFSEHVNTEIVKVQRVQTEEGEAVLRGLIERHVMLTGSVKGREVLSNWEDYLPRFWQLVPPGEATLLVSRVGSRPPDSIPPPARGIDRPSMVHGIFSVKRSSRAHPITAMQACHARCLMMDYLRMVRRAMTQVLSLSKLLTGREGPRVQALD